MTAIERILAPGVVLDLAEPDYLYGTGPLRLRLATPLDTQRLAQLEWVRLIGDEIRWNGEITPGRDVNVRVSAIRAAIRPAGWLPDSARDWQRRHAPENPAGPCES
ncbi:MAG TPA: hypothetical protein VF657_15220 [Actinoplanes sp.]|jgi:hypothetical protein